MLNRTAPFVVAAATVLSVATLFASDASARPGSSGRAQASSHAQARQTSRPAAQRTRTASRVANLRPARGTSPTRATRGSNAGVASRIANIRAGNTTATRTAANAASNRVGLRTLASKKGPATTNNTPPRLIPAVAAARIANIMQRVQAGTISRAQAAMQLAQIRSQLGANPTTGTTGTTGTTTTGTVTGGQVMCIRAPCNIPGQNAPSTTNPRPTPVPGTNANNRPPQIPSSNFPSSRPSRQPQSPVEANNRGQGGNFDGSSVRGGNFGGRSFAGPVAGNAGSAPVQVATAPAAAPATCLTRTELPDGAILFRDVCTGQFAITPAPQAGEGSQS